MYADLEYVETELVCPACRGSLRLRDDAERPIVCGGCGASYAVRDGVPVLLTDREWEDLLRRMEGERRKSVDYARVLEPYML